MLDVQDLEWNLHESWEVDGRAVTPASVVLSSKSHHIGDIAAVDLSFPIIVHNRDIIDGLHRLCKAKNAKMDKIMALDIDAKTLKLARIGGHEAWPSA